MEGSACTPTAMGKVKGSDTARLGFEELIDLVGPAATLPYGADGAIGDGIIEYGHRQAQHSAVPGGTVEVFRTIVAQHDLGLPRPDYPGRRVFLTGDRPATSRGVTRSVRAGPARNGAGPAGPAGLLLCPARSSSLGVIAGLSLRRSRGAGSRANHHHPPGVKRPEVPGS